MSKNKTIIVVSYVFNLSNTVRAYAVYNALKEKYKINVLYADFDHYSKQHVKYEDEHFISVHVPGYKRNFSIMRIISTVIFGVKTMMKLNRMLPDLVYVICPPNLGAYLASRVCKKKGIPCIVDIVDLHPESIPINEKLKWVGNFLGLSLWKKLRDMAIKNTSKVIIECDYYKRVIDTRYLHKTSTVYLAKESEIIQFSNDKVQQRVINIAYLGSIGHIYDFDTLINLGEQLLERHVAFKYHIIGDGEKRDWLIKELSRKCIPYIYYGKIYDEKSKRKIMEICDFGFNGFKVETAVGLSYKSLDYMDYGLALINSTKYDTWKLVEDHKSGINYSSNNIQALTDEITQLSKNDIIKMKNKSRKLYEMLFDKPVFDRNIRKHIDDLI